MRYLLLIFSMMIGASCTSVEVKDESIPARKDIAIQNVNVITMQSDTVLQDQTILVSDGNILEFGPSADIAIPASTETIDGAGQYIMPGLSDMHVHLRHSNEEALQNYLRAGITLVREMNGRPFMLEWRDKIAAGELTGPRLIVASPTIGNFSSPREGYTTPETQEEAELRVAEFKSAGYDLIKVYSFVPKDIFLGILSAARSEDIPVSGHLSVELPLPDALEAGLTSVEHLTGYFDEIATPEAKARDTADFSGTFFGGAIDPQKLSQIADLTANSGAWNTPTIAWFTQNNPFGGSRDAWAQPDLRELGLQNRLAVVGALHKAGANIMLGTDSDDGDRLPATAIYEELQLMTDAGLSPYEALRTATTEPARYLNLKTVGSIATGNRADLIILSCDPLKNIRCIQYISTVISDGRVVF